MKKALGFFYFMLLVFGISFDGRAALLRLTNLDENVVFDTVTGHYWLWDINQFVGKTYEQQLQAIETRNGNGGYFGLSGWHMASFTEMVSLMNNTEETLWQNFPITYQEEYDSYKLYEVNARYDQTWLSSDGELMVYFATIGKQDTYCGPWWIVDTEYYSSGLGMPDYLFPHDFSGDWLGAWVTTRPAQPVPEPTSMLLFGMGLIALTGYRKIVKGKQ